MLPERLQRAEGPAEPLANEHAGRFGGFRPGDGFFVVINMPAEAAYGDGEVGIFGYGVRGDSSGGFDGFSAPGTQCAGDYGDAVEQVEGALFHVLAGDVLERLPAREPARAVADFDIAGDR